LEEPANRFLRLIKWGKEQFSSAQKYKGVAENIPTIREFVQAFDQYLFSKIQSQIVCFDDLERRGGGLSVRDTLGLISFLREERKCKVVILLNKGELGEGGVDFDEFSEKVIDVTLIFEPEPKESVDIALLDGDAPSKLIGEFCVTLGISNIRVIKKIERFVRIIYPTVKDFEEAVAHQTVQSLALFAWSKYQPNDAPPVEFLRKQNASGYLPQNGEEAPEGEAKWIATLEEYKFTNIDELDLALLDGIENGFFDFDRIKNLAASLNEQIKFQNMDSSFSAAWDMYHGSFSDNEEEVVTAIYNSFKKNVETVSLLNLSGTINLLKELGHDEKAGELISYFVDNRDEVAEFWALEGHHHFPGDVTDEEIISAFQSKLATFESDFDPITSLQRIAKENSWNRADTKGLANTTSEEFYEIFKTYSGSDRIKIIRAAVKFSNIGNASAEMQEISKRAKEALTKIGQESAINARRVNMYGINIDNS
jgi:hypothetical protein